MPVQANSRQLPDALRPMDFLPGFQHSPAGSVLITAGNTRVICAVSIVEGVPSWLKPRSAEEGWLTAEYQMLPGATAERAPRELAKGKPSGRSAEIQRLIGRSLRAAIDLKKLPGRTVYVDCDVLDADGGTRCASITGASVALELACRNLLDRGLISEWPVRCRIAAVSVGLVEGIPTLDLCYAEDVSADVDMNVVMTDAGEYVEIQGTAEGRPFSQTQMDDLLALARRGLTEIFEKQNEVVKCVLAGPTGELGK